MISLKRLLVAYGIVTATRPRTCWNTDLKHLVPPRNEPWYITLGWALILVGVVLIGFYALDIYILKQSIN